MAFGCSSQLLRAVWELADVDFIHENRAGFALRRSFVMVSGFYSCRILCGHLNVDISDHPIIEIESAACATESESFFSTTKA